MSNVSLYFFYIFYFSFIFRKMLIPRHCHPWHRLQHASTAHPSARHPSRNCLTDRLLSSHFLLQEPRLQQKMIDTTIKLAHELHVVGMINIQYIVYANELYLIEVNPRSSRTVPYISKVTGVPMVDLAVRAMLGEKIRDMGYGTLRPGAARMR